MLGTADIPRKEEEPTQAPSVASMLAQQLLSFGMGEGQVTEFMTSLKKHEAG